ncbi:dnaJ homolog subfamily C member 24 isoform X2 [Lampris incognitus]|uniref:dnaJ homolog subfamily C member 24 isoform X2 n=1 Tax=Lampris incognitus TaxID=2546036 RepID=UPI0024B53DA5|nr:dnaJ homolog subfamily C member 24 isoform X2 [Lampris incognitus]
MIFPPFTSPTVIKRHLATCLFYSKREYLSNPERRTQEEIAATQPWSFLYQLGANGMSGESAQKDLYSVLGASSSDSLQQLKHRYQQLALQYHPDRLGNVCPCEAETGLKKFLEADAAWRVLSDDTSRREYDLQRRAKELKQDWPVDSAVCLEDMTWDMDNSVYTYGCRCGGEFAVTVEEIEGLTEERGCRMEEEERGLTVDEMEKKVEEEGRGEGEGVVVCCDTCSLCVYVTRSRTY